MIRDKPAAVLMWGLAYFVVVMAPMMAVLAAIVPDFIELSKLTEAEAASDTASVAALVTLQAKMMLLQTVQFVSTFAAAVILYGAVFRAVLEPQENRHWYLRLGRQEAWLAFVWLVALALMAMAMFVALIPLSFAGVLVSVATKGGGDPMSWLMPVVVGVCAVGLFLWASIRLALAFPMTFAERKFRLFESWGLTRGHAGRMALTFFAALGLVWLFQLVVLVLLLALGWAVLAANGVTIPWNQGPDATMTAPRGGWGPFLMVVVPCAALLVSIVVAALQTISVAPLAYIYRQLTAADAVTASGA